MPAAAQKAAATKKAAAAKQQPEPEQAPEQPQEQPEQPKAERKTEQKRKAEPKQQPPKGSVDLGAKQITYYFPSVTWPDGSVRTCEHTKYGHETEKAARRCAASLQGQGQPKSQSEQAA